MYIDDEELSNRVYIPPRASKDHVIDTNGKRLSELCQSTSFIIGNGRLHDDLNVGEFTFHSHRGSSLVDYLLLEPKDIFLVSNFKILQPNELSDHSGILFSLASRHAADEEGSKSEASYDYNIKWDDLKIDPFKNVLSQYKAQLCSLEQSILNERDIDKGSKRLYKYFKTECNRGV
ncbi:hypothetical protein DPMN_086359 [Dreissena polymorpha]|uniref:Uncharacterized protein n=1 Tax=Dreissena polymorpha TaxID=45954 RepID=A0A9D4KRQ4_DREPO|nr:hypothetical protein DPMN_086359 [Dreissena polymorpha]